MLEFELLVKEIEKLRSKEKSIRKKILLENAIKSLNDYYKLSE